jgi:hypothetical protein
MLVTDFDLDLTEEAPRDLLQSELELYEFKLSTINIVEKL